VHANRLLEEATLAGSNILSHFGLVDPALDSGLILCQLAGLEPERNLFLGRVNAICMLAQLTAMVLRNLVVNNKSI